MSRTPSRNAPPKTRYEKVIRNETEVTARGHACLSHRSATALSGKPGRWDHPTIGETLMSASSQTSRLTRFAMLALTGVTAVSVAACGASNKPGPTTSPSTTSSAAAPTTSSTSPPATGQARVSGLIASVSGNTATVTQEKGNAAVAFTPSTKVIEVTAAALTDVTAGNCVTVRPAHESAPGQPLTARSVRVSPAVDGKCPQGTEATPGGSTTPAPPGAPQKRAR